MRMALQQLLSCTDAYEPSDVRRAMVAVLAEERPRTAGVSLFLRDGLPALDDQPAPPRSGSALSPVWVGRLVLFSQPPAAQPDNLRPDEDDGEQSAARSEMKYGAGRGA